MDDHNDTDLLNTCNNSDDIKKLEDRAIMLLARREHSTKELMAKLEQKTHLSEVVIHQVVTSLSDKGYQSDTRFTDMYLRSQLNKQCGPVKILHDLKQYGIGSEDATFALMAAEVDWVALALRALNKKYSTTPLPYGDKVKAHRFLKGRGFEFSHIDSALKLFLSKV